MAAAIAGVIVEVLVIRRLYDRDHLDQVLATFALILIFSEGTRWVFGSFPLYLDVPDYPVGRGHAAGGHSLSALPADDHRDRAGGRGGAVPADREDPRRASASARGKATAR
jgi:hypothetical protein